MYIDPPLGVQGLCSVVVWYRPEVPCEDIRGYEVRLYNPRSAHLNVTDRVGANGTYYIIVDEENVVSSDETFVQVFFHTNNIICSELHYSSKCMQVRAIYRQGVGQWSEGTSLGKEV